MVASLKGALLAALLTLTAPGGLQAHAVLLGTTPEAGAVVATAPEAILLRFNEPVRAIALQILRAEDQTTIEPVDVLTLDSELRALLPEGAPDGTYVVSYRVTSADAHPVAGSFVFGVGASTSAPEAITSTGGPDDAFWRRLGVVARALWYGALLLAAGLALFLVLLPVPPDLVPRLGRALRGLAIVGGASGPMLLAATGGALLGGPPAALLTFEPWRLAAGSPVAWTVASAALGLGLLVLGRSHRSLLVAGALLVALSFGLSGHAPTAGPRWLTLPALALHALSAAFWIGAFGPLLLALRHAEAKALLHAFSTLAVPAVACLIVAGSLLAVLQLASWSALVTSDYGQRLLMKLGLVALLLSLAALNRWLLTPALGRRADAAVWLRRTIGAELALAAGVVVLTASLGAVPPPRALAGQAAAHIHAPQASPDYAIHAAAKGFNLVLVATPARVGANRIDLYFSDRDGQPVSAKAAELSVALPEQGVEALTFPALPVAPGHFRADAALPLPGAWQVRADLLIDDFTKLGFQARIVVGP